jgi:hypothetical protein
MVLDAFGPNPPSHAFVLSADSDLMPAIFALEERAPVRIPVTVLLPSHDARKWSADYQRSKMRLRECHQVSAKQHPPLEVRRPDEKTLANSLLPYELQDHAGKFSCPSYWRLDAGYLSKHGAAPVRPGMQRRRESGEFR